MTRSRRSATRTKMLRTRCDFPACALDIHLSTNDAPQRPQNARTHMTIKHTLISIRTYSSACISIRTNTSACYMSASRGTCVCTFGPISVYVRTCVFAVHFSLVHCFRVLKPPCVGGHSKMAAVIYRCHCAEEALSLDSALIWHQRVRIGLVRYQEPRTYARENMQSFNLIRHAGSLVGRRAQLRTLSFPRLG